MYQHNKITKKTLQQFNRAIIALGLYIADNMLVIREPKTFHFDLPEYIHKNLKHEIEFIIKRNESIFRNAQNSKPHKFVLNLSQILDVRSSNKHVVLQNLSIYYT